MSIDEIKADIYTRATERRAGEYADPQLLPDLLNRVLTELTALAEDEDVVLAEDLIPAGDWAANLLTLLHERATTGVPFGEPPEQPWETVLSGDGDLG